MTSSSHPVVMNCDIKTISLLLKAKPSVIIIIFLEASHYDIIMTSL